MGRYFWCLKARLIFNYLHLSFLKRFVKHIESFMRPFAMSDKMGSNVL
jgi:hypothetical protein